MKQQYLHSTRDLDRRGVTAFVREEEDMTREEIIWVLLVGGAVLRALRRISEELTKAVDYRSAVLS
jgi:hypothetical protein